MIPISDEMIVHLQSTGAAADGLSYLPRFSGLSRTETTPRGSPVTPLTLSPADGGASVTGGPVDPSIFKHLPIQDIESMEVKNNELHFDGVGAQSLADKYGTPLYVYEAETIRKRLNELQTAIHYPHLKVHYAAKTNSNLAILRLLRNEGVDVETVSEGSVMLALKAGFKPNQIIYTANGIKEEELKFLIDQKIWVNLDSLSQVETWGKLNPGSNIGIRLNLGIGAGSHRHLKTGGSKSKFGIHMSHIRDVKSLARKYNLRITGLHQHIGTTILGARKFVKAAKALLQIADQFADVEIINFGGGFGIPYKETDAHLDLKELGTQIDKLLSHYAAAHRKEPTVVIEPGRYLLANAGTLLAMVTDVKTNPERTFVSLDTGMGHLVRPAMYGSYHKIINASRVKGKNQTVTVVGNLCESGDTLGEDRLINKPKEGDLLAILDAGAHGFVMSSFYNARLRPAEILIDGGKPRLIRRRQTLEEALPYF